MSDNDFNTTGWKSLRNGNLHVEAGIGQVERGGIGEKVEQQELQSQQEPQEQHELQEQQPHQEIQGQQEQQEQQAQQEPQEQQEQQKKRRRFRKEFGSKRDTDWSLSRNYAERLDGELRIADESTPLNLSSAFISRDGDSPLLLLPTPPPPPLPQNRLHNVPLNAFPNILGRNTSQGNFFNIPNSSIPSRSFRGSFGNYAEKEESLDDSSSDDSFSNDGLGEDGFSDDGLGKVRDGSLNQPTKLQIITTRPRNDPSPSLPPRRDGMDDYDSNIQPFHSRRRSSFITEVPMSFDSLPKQRIDAGLEYSSEDPTVESNSDSHHMLPRISVRDSPRINAATPLSNPSQNSPLNPQLFPVNTPNTASLALQSPSTHNVELSQPEEPPLSRDEYDKAKAELIQYSTKWLGTPSKKVGSSPSKTFCASPFTINQPEYQKKALAMVFGGGSPSSQNTKQNNIQKSNESERLVECHFDRDSSVSDAPLKADKNTLLPMESRAIERIQRIKKPPPIAIQSPSFRSKSRGPPVFLSQSPNTREVFLSEDFLLEDSSPQMHPSSKSDNEDDIKRLFDGKTKKINKQEFMGDTPTNHSPIVLNQYGKRIRRNAFPQELTGGYYNLRFQSLTGNMEKIDDIFQYFIHEATPNASSILKGLSALHSACLMEHKHVLEYLLREGANPNQESHAGTPVQIAILKKNVDMLELLLKYGADCNLRCREDQNAVDPHNWSPSETYQQFFKSPTFISQSTFPEDFSPESTQNSKVFQTDIHSIPSAPRTPTPSSSLQKSIRHPRPDGTQKRDILHSTKSTNRIHSPGTPGTPGTPSTQRSAIFTPNAIPNQSLIKTNSYQDIYFESSPNERCESPLIRKQIRSSSPMKKSLLVRKSPKKQKSLKPVKSIPKATVRNEAEYFFSKEEQIFTQLISDQRHYREDYPLASCIKSNYIEGVKLLFTRSEAIIEDGSGFEAMNMCVYYDKPEILSLLLPIYKRRYEKSVYHTFTQTAMRKAIALNRAQIAKVLMLNHVALRKHVFQPLFIEILQRNFVDVLHSLLKFGANDIPYVQETLFSTVTINRPSCCDVILRNKVPVDLRDQNGFTALQLATQFNLTHVVSVLLNYHANPNLFTPDSGYNSFHIAVKNQNYEIASMILRHANIDLPGKLDPKSVLQIATLNNDTKMVRLLLTGKPNLEACSHTVAPVLHTACMKGFLELVDIFIEHGANIEFPYRAGSPIHNLVVGWKGIPNREAILQRLISNGAKIESQSHSGLYPIQLAVEYDSLDALHILNKFKVSLSVVHPENGDSLVHIAARKGNLKMLETLLLIGAWPRNRNYRNQLPQDVIPPHLTSYQDCYDILMTYNRMHDQLFENAAEANNNHRKTRIFSVEETSSSFKLK